MRSILQSGLLIASLVAVLLAPASAHADACTYGVCDATTCGTNGHRFPTNSPCTGAPSLTCSAPACPSCTYGSCSATVCGTSGTQSATNLPCTGPLAIACNAPACPACVYGACSAECGGGSQVAFNQPCTGPASQTCNEQTCPVPVPLLPPVALVALAILVGAVVTTLGAAVVKRMG